MFNYEDITIGELERFNHYYFECDGDKKIVIAKERIDIDE